MELESLIRLAEDSGASDLHLEPGLSPAMRIRGTLCVAGEAIPAKDLAEMAQLLTGEEQWPSFLERHSFDLSKTIQGVRCRINILRTSRGVGMAIRFLAFFQATVKKLNLHPDLKKFIKHAHGLILVSGPTGCGKSSTLAALIQDINLTETGAAPMLSNVAAAKAPQKNNSLALTATAKAGSRIKIEAGEGGLGKILKKLE